MLQTLLLKIAARLESGYVQGMNYIAGALLFHSGESLEHAFQGFMEVERILGFSRMFDAEMSGFHE